MFQHTGFESQHKQKALRNLKVSSENCQVNSNLIILEILEWMTREAGLNQNGVGLCSSVRNHQ